MKIPQKGMYIPRAALVVGVGLSLCAGATFASATPRVNDITPNLSAPPAERNSGIRKLGETTSNHRNDCQS